MKPKFYRFLRRFNDGIPTKMEILYWLNRRDHYITNRITLVMMMYTVGFTLEDIGSNMDSTRERARQMLLKGCRHNKFTPFA